MVGKPLKVLNTNIRYGLKTGLNNAFIITKDIKDELIKEDPKSTEIIRPILRGRDILKDSYNFAEKYMINTHNGYIDKDGSLVERVDVSNYSAVKNHLDKFEPRLSNRYDQGDTPYNLRSTAYMDEFFQPKIMYSEIVQTPRFFYDRKGEFIGEASSFILSGEYLDYLIHWLNSDVTA